MNNFDYIKIIAELCKNNMVAVILAPGVPVIAKNAARSFHIFSGYKNVQIGHFSKLRHP